MSAGWSMLYDSTTNIVIDIMLVENINTHAHSPLGCEIKTTVSFLQTCRNISFLKTAHYIRAVVSWSTGQCIGRYALIQCFQNTPLTPVFREMNWPKSAPSKIRIGKILPCQHSSEAVDEANSPTHSSSLSAS